VTVVVVGAARWVEYAGLLGFVGVVVLRVLAGQPPQIRWARPRMDLALGAALLGGASVLIAQWTESGSVPIAVAVRVAAEVVALALCRTIGRGAVPAGFLAAAALAFGGHAADAQPALPAILVDCLHVLSAGAWAGGILALAALRPPFGWASEEGRGMLRRFGGVAAPSFAVTALTGVLRATATLNGLGDLWTTAYGEVLAAKTAGVVVMLAMSAIAWRRGVPLAKAEAAVALGVVAASAVLAVLPLPVAVSTIR
jgi:putative copper resistance protein D